MSKKAKSLVVWCVWDMKAGHRSQTKGLVDSLRLQFDVRQVDIEYAKWTRPIGRLLQKVWPMASGCATWGMKSGANELSVKPDLVVGSGGGVQWAVAALARKFSSYSIYLGSPRGIPVKDYGMVLHYVPKLATKGVCIIPMMPGPVSKDMALSAWDKFSEDKHLRPGKHACCLVGGNGSGYEWSAKDGLLLGKLMNDLAKKLDIRWLVSTSRRTPEAMEQALKNTLNAELIADACWAGEGDDRRIVAAYLGGAELALVSEDSMSMVQESLASQRRVCVFGSAQFTADQRHEQFMQNAELQGWLSRISLEDHAATETIMHSQAHYGENLPELILHVITQKLVTAGVISD